MTGCQATAELLPWFLNGTLSDGELREVRAHLAGCRQCQQELKEALFVRDVVQAHVPTTTLVDYAFKRSVAPFDLELIRRHLAACEECAAEFEMARESWRWAEGEVDDDLAPEVETATAAPVAAGSARWWEMLRWPRVALATALLALIAFGGWLWNRRQERARQADLTAQERVMSERLAGLEAENQRLRQDGAELRQQRDEAQHQIAQLQEKLQEQVEDLSSPQLNTPVIDLHPSELNRRSPAGPPVPPVVNELVTPSGTKVVTLILNSQSTASYPSYSLEIVKAQKVVWGAQGLVRHSSNDYTISLPADLLSPGSYRINVYGKGQGPRVKVDSYQMLVKPSRP